MQSKKKTKVQKMFCQMMLLVNYELKSQGPPSNTGTKKTSYWTHERSSRQAKTLAEETQQKTQRA